MILKNVLNRIKSNNEETELSNDTLITLSQIESGCLFTQHKDKTLMIIICTGEEASNLKNSENFSLKMELIEKLEFPTIAAYIKIMTKNKDSYDFEYFFNIEASEELELVENLSNQSTIEIMLYDDDVVHSMLLGLSREVRSLLTSMHERAKHMFDKA